MDTSSTAAGPWADDDVVVVGRLTAPWGVRGFLKVRSFTDPPDNLLAYGPWLVREPRGDTWQPLDVDAVQPHGGAWVAHVSGFDDRDEARARFGNRDIAVPRTELPEPEEDEAYWHDLVGLRVVTAEGVALGTVTELMATGANDVLVVREDAGDPPRERLVPWIDGVVLETDLAAGRLVVAWDPDF